MRTGPQNVSHAPIDPNDHCQAPIGPHNVSLAPIGPDDPFEELLLWEQYPHLAPSAHMSSDVTLYTD